MSKTEINWREMIPDSNIFWLLVGISIGILLSMIIVVAIIDVASALTLDESRDMIDPYIEYILLMQQKTI